SGPGEEVFPSYRLTPANLDLDAHLIAAEGVAQSSPAPAAASANGNTGPLPYSRRSDPATVSVQRESTISSISRTGPGWTREPSMASVVRAFASLSTLFCIARWGWDSPRVVRHGTYGRPSSGGTTGAKGAAGGGGPATGARRT